MNFCYDKTTYTHTNTIIMHNLKYLLNNSYFLLGVLLWLIYWTSIFRICEQPNKNISEVQWINNLFYLQIVPFILESRMISNLLLHLWKRIIFSKWNLFVLQMSTFLFSTTILGCSTFRPAIVTDENLDNVSIQGQPLPVLWPQPFYANGIFSSIKNCKSWILSLWCTIPHNHSKH